MRKRSPEQEGPRPVESLLDAMVEGKEYGSIVAMRPKDGNLVPELQRGIAAIEAIRKRRCLCYVANVIKDLPDTTIHPSDHLPFSEMVERTPSEYRDADIFLVTPGGVAEQVIQFVEVTRNRFDSIEFLLPYKTMSAGTLWCLSGDNIWMDERACLGPVDPQVKAKDGGLAPAQAILTLLNDLQQRGQEALNKKEPIPWTVVRLLDQMDQVRLGQAITSTGYVKGVASDYIERYKFKEWNKHSTTGAAVTPEEKKNKASIAAAAICSHAKWQAHGHPIGREEVMRELLLKVKKIESEPGLQLAVRKLWALFYYVFDKTTSAKIILSQDYAFVRNAAR